MREWTEARGWRYKTPVFEVVCTPLAPRALPDLIALMVPREGVRGSEWRGICMVAYAIVLPIIVLKYAIDTPNY